MSSIHASSAYFNPLLKAEKIAVVFERYCIGILDCEWKVIRKPEPSIAFDLNEVELARENGAMIARTHDLRTLLTYTVPITFIKTYGIAVGNGSQVLLPLRYWDETFIDGRTAFGEQTQPRERHR